MPATRPSFEEAGGPSGQSAYEFPLPILRRQLRETNPLILLEFLHGKR